MEIASVRFFTSAFSVTLAQLSSALLALLKVMILSDFQVRPQQAETCLEFLFSYRKKF